MSLPSAIPHCAPTFLKLCAKNQQMRQKYQPLSTALDIPKYKKTHIHGNFTPSIDLCDCLDNAATRVVTTLNEGEHREIPMLILTNYCELAVS